MKKMQEETFNIDGKTITIIINWDLFKATPKNKQKFLKINYYLNLINGSLISEYTDSSCKIKYTDENGEVRESATGDTLISGIKKRLQSLENEKQGVHIEKIEINGELKEVPVDWNLYQSEKFGSHVSRSKKGFIEANYYIQLLNGELSKPYMGARSKIFFEIDGVEQSYVSLAGLISNIQFRLKRLNERKSGTETIVREINNQGVLTKIELIIDWDKFKGNIHGSNYEKNKKGYIDFLFQLSLVNGKLKSDYVNRDTKVIVAIDDVSINQIPCNFLRTINTIVEFKDLCTKNDDTFIKICSLNKHGAVRALIRLKHGAIVEKSFENYNFLIKGRKKFLRKLNEIDAITITDYLSNKDKIKIKLGDLRIEKSVASIFHMVESVQFFFQTLNLNKHHKFIKWIAYQNRATGLTVLIENEYNGKSGEFEIQLNKYNYNDCGFLTGEKNCYEYAQQNGHKLLSPYLGANKDILIEFEDCPHGPQSKKVAYITTNKGCKKCGISARSKENHHAWEGGITDLYTTLRGKIYNWRNQSLNYYGPQCIITKSKAQAVHHLYSFHNIVRETLDSLNLSVLSEYGLYSPDEQDLIEKKCLELHDSYGWGVPLSKECHEEFHRIYGKSNNTKEQFISYCVIKGIDFNVLEKPIEKSLSLK